ncbi:unnamed protein product, partial [Adineta steineri]
MSTITFGQIIVGPPGS